MSQQHILTANVVAVAKRAHDAKLDVGTPLTVIADDGEQSIKLGATTLTRECVGTEAAVGIRESNSGATTAFLPSSTSPSLLRRSSTPARATARWAAAG